VSRILSESVSEAVSTKDASERRKRVEKPLFSLIPQLLRGHRRVPLIQGKGSPYHIWQRNVRRLSRGISIRLDIKSSLYGHSSVAHLFETASENV
jgi:hypothetical protein